VLTKDKVTQCSLQNMSRIFIQTHRHVTQNAAFEEICMHWELNCYLFFSHQILQPSKVSQHATVM